MKLPPPKPQMPKVDIKCPTLDTFSLPAGMVHYKVRDVILYGKAEYVCLNINNSCARFICATKSFKFVKVGTDKFGEDEFKSESTPRTLSISNCCERGFVIRVMPQDEFNNFLPSHRPTRKEQIKTTTVGEENNNTNQMKKKNKIAKKSTTNGRIKATDEQLAKAISKAAKDATDQSILDGVRASGLSASLPRIEALRGGKAATAKPAAKASKAVKGKVTPKATKLAKSAPAPKKAASTLPPPPKTTPPVPAPKAV